MVQIVFRRNKITERKKQGYKEKDWGLLEREGVGVRMTRKGRGGGGRLTDKLNMLTRISTNSSRTSGLP